MEELPPEGGRKLPTLLEECLNLCAAFLFEQATLRGHTVIQRRMLVRAHR
jgi:hypothetical protein